MTNNPILEYTCASAFPNLNYQLQPDFVKLTIFVGTSICATSFHGSAAISPTDISEVVSAGRLRKLSLGCSVSNVAKLLSTCIYE